MMIAINILMLILLFYVFYEDVKDKKVTAIILIALIIVGAILNGMQQIFTVFLISSLINIMVVSFVIFVLFLYSKIKMKIDLFQGFGLGDLLFFLFMAVSFPTLSFLILFSTSLIFSLILSVAFRQKLKELVPLAGLQALFLGLVIGANQLFDIINLYAL